MEADGSLVQNTEHGRKSIATMLRKSGFGEAPILDALRRFDEAPDNEKVALGADIEAVKWTIERIEPDFRNSALLSSLVPLKIAYEFLACHLGAAIYDEAPQLEEIRQVLNEGAEEHACFTVERLTSSEYKPFHGLVFEGNDPHAKVQIRLFGWLGFRVHLNRLSVGGDRFVYTHLLDSKDRGCANC